MEGTSLILSVPNIISSNPGGGRFDFDDGGTYCGGWQDGKAHGHGVCTGPKNVGEYSGSWNFGFEMSGVYKWTNGAVYEGRWQNGKRHGVGVEYNGKWIYKGEWSQGFKGRYGVKASSNSAVKYEGTWANGLQDGYGSETYSDGGYYQGQMCRGLRHGYGVRKSAPYGDSQLNNRNKNGNFANSSTGLHNSLLIHSNSLQSAASVDSQDDTPKLDDGFKPNIDRTLASKNGFVLVAKPLDVPMVSKYNGDNGGKSSANGRRSSLTNKLTAAKLAGSNQTASLLKGLRLRRQKSTSDLDAMSNNKSLLSGHDVSSSSRAKTPEIDLNTIPFTLSPEELDITDPTTVETYTGEWKHDKRNGHGVCDRSDGLKYEGQWHNDMKTGYGVTTFKNGTKEEGKYKNNILIVDSKVKRFFQLGSATMRQKIDEAVKMAHQAQNMALKKAEIADTRAATARDKADQATTAAIEADRDSQIAYAVARQYSDSQQHNISSNQQINMLMNPITQVPMNQNNLMSDQNPLYSNQLQMRRASHMNQNRFLPNQMDQIQNKNMNDHLNQQYQDQMHVGDRQTQQQFLGPAEPFNGRRGSFREASHLSAGASGNSRTSGLNFAPTNQTFGQSTNRQNSSDPFNDLFDHYKPSSSGAAASTTGFSNTSSRLRRMPSRQTSLDYNQMRASVPRQFGTNAPSSVSGTDRLRKFRMSSMDHAEENNLNQEHMSPDDLVNQSEQQVDRESGLQNRFKHLVTSGELLKSQPQGHDNKTNQNKPTNESHVNQSNQQRDPTPTSSSYILPPSANSSLFGTQTPSPETMSFRPPSSSYYGANESQLGASSMASYPSKVYSNIGNGGQFSSHMMPMPQRDVHSLADDQLYISAGRRGQAGVLDRSEFSNYDFTITSGPRMSQRCLRRTASLSRHMPASRSAVYQSSLNSGELRNSSSNGASISNTFTLSGTPIASGKQTSTQVRPSDQLSQSIGTQRHRAHDESQDWDLVQTNSGSRLTVDSAGSSGPLVRKPSLQVRYDPIALGGLMSREEVAALSHAQREQKRLEQELAERRSKRPMLHLYLTIKEFIIQQKLLITVLVINLFQFKLFADLIT